MEVLGMLERGTRSDTKRRHLPGGTFTREAAALLTHARWSLRITSGSSCQPVLFIGKGSETRRCGMAEQENPNFRMEAARLASMALLADNMAFAGLLRELAAGCLARALTREPPPGAQPRHTRHSPAPAG